MVCFVVLLLVYFLLCVFFFFNDTATTEIYTLSLHDALPISRWPGGGPCSAGPGPRRPRRDRKSTRLNSSHGYISYAVFCLKKKTTKNTIHLEASKQDLALLQGHAATRI